MRDSLPRPATTSSDEAPLPLGEATTAEVADPSRRADAARRDAQTTRPPSGWSTYVLLVSIVVTIFARILWHGFVNWDDGQHVYANPVVTEPWSRPLFERLTTPSVGYPTPLPSFVHGLAWAAGRGAAWPLHACSLAIHVVIAALLLRGLQRRGVDPWLALGGTLAFAIHPIVVEPVAWVTGLKDLGVGLAVAWLFVRPIPGALPDTALPTAADAPADTPARRRSYRLGELGAWLAAITSKPSAGLLGFAFVVRAWLTSTTPGTGSPSTGSWDRASTLLLAVATSTAGLFTLWFARAHQPDTIRTTLDAPWTLSRPLAALGVTTEHVLAPMALSPVTPASSTTTLHVLLGTLVALGLATAWAYFVRRRDERGYWLTLAMLAWLPVSNVVPLVRFTADSYAYVPWLLVCATLTVSIQAFASSSLGRASSRIVGRMARIAGLCWLALLSLGSALQVGIWRDDVTLWTAAVETHPDEGALIVRLGDALGRSGDVRGELALYFAHEDTLEDHGVVPPALLAFLGARGEDEALARWFAIGLRADVEQAEPFFGYYAAFVVRTGVPPADTDLPAVARGLSLVEANPSAYGITTPLHEAALADWRRRLSTPVAPR